MNEGLDAVDRLHIADVAVESVDGVERNSFGRSVESTLARFDTLVVQPAAEALGAVDETTNDLGDRVLDLLERRRLSDNGRGLIEIEDDTEERSFATTRLLRLISEKRSETGERVDDHLQDSAVNLAFPVTVVTSASEKLALSKSSSTRVGLDELFDTLQELRSALVSADAVLELLSAITFDLVSDSLEFHDLRTSGEVRNVRNELSVGDALNDGAVENTDVFADVAREVTELGDFTVALLNEFGDTKREPVQIFDTRLENVLELLDACKHDFTFRGSDECKFLIESGEHLLETFDVVVVSLILESDVESIRRNVETEAVEVSSLLDGFEEIAIEVDGVNIIAVTNLLQNLPTKTFRNSCGDFIFPVLVLACSVVFELFRKFDVSFANEFGDFRTFLVQHAFILEAEDRLLEALVQGRTPVDGTSNARLILGQRRIVLVSDEDSLDALDFKKELLENAIRLGLKKFLDVESVFASTRAGVEGLEGLEEFEGRFSRAEFTIEDVVDELCDLLVERSDAVIEVGEDEVPVVN